MLAITILLLGAAPATHHVRAAHPTPVVHHGHVVRKPRRSLALTSKKLQVVAVRSTPTRSPYRLPLGLPAEPMAKDIALNEDGTRCALIGQTICKRPTRTIVRMGEDSPITLPVEAPH
ncbi:hypothetical protein GCM10009087_22610 [Sphingomonas oligophenolica]|uniref:Uncharacterized protein n=1 Tax=Sphingomonas oligophenolica TaxID=301154 RepID=A0ABU9Y1T3_9SPHN